MSPKPSVDIGNDDPFDNEYYMNNVANEKLKLDNQLKEIRKEKHNTFTSIKCEVANDIKSPNKKFDTNYHYHNEDKINPDSLWPQKTILIVGDSMINQLDEERLSKSSKRNVKVRSFGGATIKMMYDRITPLLKKKPETVILHVGTADATYKSSNEIMDDLLKLNYFIENSLGDCNVVFSLPITRTDNGKAQSTIKRIIERSKNLDINVKCLPNTNIGENCLGRKGLHLNPRGVGRFAINLRSLIQKL